MSHNLISKHKPGVKLSGITIDVKSGIKIDLNFYFKLLVWTEDGKVEEARSMYISYAQIGRFSAYSWRGSLRFNPSG